MDFFPDQLLHLEYFHFALAAVGLHHLFQVIDVEEKDIVEVSYLRIDITRNCDVDEE